MPKFVPRERKHKRLAKQAQSSVLAASNENANTEVLLPQSAAEKEERRRKLQEELRAQQPQSKISSKKRKRLDHYIDTKLRKEENLELIKKLATHKVDTSLLQSSRKLGRVQESKREAFERALREKSAGVDVRGDHDNVLLERRKEVLAPELDDGEESEASVEESPEVAESSIQPAQPPTLASSGLFGSGLKRQLETDESGQPLIKRRKRRKPAKKPTLQQYQPEEDSETAEDEESEDQESGSEAESVWNGFDSDELSGVDELDSADNGDITKEDDTESSEEDDEESEDEEDDDEDEDEDDDLDKAARSSAFKLWATAQRNEALGFQPSTLPTDDAAARASFKPRAPSPDLLAQEISMTNTSTTSRPAYALTIPRAEDIQKTRLELPVVQEEQKIMEAINNNSTIIVCGATGSGKTTQVPQMMFEGGYGSQIGVKTAEVESKKSPQSRGMIGVTQPRRVAAVSVAQRVAAELGPKYKNRVAHQVRYDTTTSKDTAIKFMTDGILLREISQDFILSKYSAIVIDEAHERSVNTDILIGMLSRIAGLREDLTKEDSDKYYPLKLVVMSATLRVSDFAQNQRLFLNGTPPIVQAEGRQYPVTVHFSRKTQRDFVAETASKVSRGHRKLPPGAMLVFLTGQNEIQAVLKRLGETLGGNTAGSGGTSKARESADQMPLEMDDLEDAANRKRDDTLEGEDSDDSDAEITGLDDADDKEFEVEEDERGPRGMLKAHILPLYASLPSAQQMRVFQAPPEGSRLIVLATNVAETSLTIPGIRYVFDCGRSKEKKYDTTTGVQTFEIDWISKASASQRSGRAGRTGPGHCYRLYSSAVYEQYFAEHSVPELLRTPLESTVLQLKAMNIDNVVNFPFPTPPDRHQLAIAEKLLRNLGAIDEKMGRITDIGKELIQYPLSPRFGKMLLLGQRNGILAHTIGLVAALGVGELFLPEARLMSVAGGRDDDESDEDADERHARREMQSAALTAAQQGHQAYTRAQASLARWDDHSDAIKLLTAVAAHADALSRSHSTDRVREAQNSAKFCDDFYLREKGMTELQQLRRQLHSIVRSRQRVTGSGVDFKLVLPLASERERKMLNQVVTAGFIDQLAIRADLLPDAAPSSMRKPRRATEVPYRTLFPSNNDEVDRSAPPETQEFARSVFIHPSSVLAHLSVKEVPAYVVYSHLSRTAPSTINIEAQTSPRTRMHPLTTVSAKEIAALAEGTPLLELGKPVGKIEELEASKRRRCWVSVGLKAGATAGATAWPVGAWKVEQVRGTKGDWKIEKVLAK